MRTTLLVIESGRVTLPAHIREAYDITEGDRVELDVIGRADTAPNGTAVA